MELEEFKTAYEFGVGAGRGPVDPQLFGVDTHEEVLETLAETASEPLRVDTYIYQLTGIETRLVGINAKSREQAEDILERKRPVAVKSSYVGELNSLGVDDE